MGILLKYSFFILNKPIIIYFKKTTLSFEIQEKAYLFNEDCNKFLKNLL